MGIYIILAVNPATPGFQVLRVEKENVGHIGIGLQQDLSNGQNTSVKFQAKPNRVEKFEFTQMYLGTKGDSSRVINACNCKELGVDMHGPIRGAGERRRVRGANSINFTSLHFARSRARN